MTWLLIFKKGKHEFKALDLVFILSELFKISKAETRRLLEQGAFDLMVNNAAKKNEKNVL